MLKMSSNSTFGSRIGLILLSKGGGVGWEGTWGGRRGTVADATLGRNRDRIRGDSSNKTKNKTRMEGTPPTRTRIELEAQEQGLNCLE